MKTRTPMQTALCVAAMGLVISGAGAAEPQHELLYAAYERAVNRGDAEAASALYAPDGMVRGTRFCPADNPCVGREAVRDRFFKPLVQLGLRLSQLDTQSEGDTFTVRLEARNQAVSKANFSRVIVIDRFVIRDGMFRSVDTSYDRSDAETAQFLATFAAPPAVPTSK